MGKRAVFQYIPCVKVHLIRELLRIGYTETEKMIFARNIPAQARIRLKLSTFPVIFKHIDRHRVM
jgi:hypothetical protein